MFQLEKCFEQKMIDFGDQEVPVCHYPVAEVLFAQPVWHILGLLSVKEPDGKIYKRRSHFLTSRASLVASMLTENTFEETTVFVMMQPPLTTSMAAEVVRCTSIWRCSDKNDPKITGWGWDTEGGAFADPADSVQIENAIKGKVVWEDF